METLLIDAQHLPEVDILIACDSAVCHLTLASSQCIAYVPRLCLLCCFTSHCTLCAARPAIMTAKNGRRERKLPVQQLTILCTVDQVLYISSLVEADKSTSIMSFRRAACEHFTLSISARDDRLTGRAPGRHRQMGRFCGSGIQYKPSCDGHTLWSLGTKLRHCVADDYLLTCWQYVEMSLTCFCQIA